MDRPGEGRRAGRAPRVRPRTVESWLTAEVRHAKGGGGEDAVVMAAASPRRLRELASLRPRDRVRRRAPWPRGTSLGSVGPAAGAGWMRCSRTLPPTIAHRPRAGWFPAAPCSVRCPPAARGRAARLRAGRQREDGPPAIVGRRPWRPGRLGLGRARRSGRAALLAVGGRCGGRCGRRGTARRARRRHAGVPRRGRRRAPAVRPALARRAARPGHRRPP